LDYSISRFSSIKYTYYKCPNHLILTYFTVQLYGLLIHSLDSTSVGKLSHFVTYLYNVFFVKILGRRKTGALRTEVWLVRQSL